LLPAASTPSRISAALSFAGALILTELKLCPYVGAGARYSGASFWIRDSRLTPAAGNTISYVRIAALAQHPAVRYGAPLILVAVFTGLVALVRLAADIGNASMLYLLAVMAAALMFGSRSAIITAIASMIAFNLFFIQPRYTFTVADENEWIALLLLVVTGVITGQLAGALQERARQAERREAEAVVLYDVVRLVSEPVLPDALQRLAERLRSELGLAAVVVSVGEFGTAQAGDKGSTIEAAKAAGVPPMIMTSGPPPGDATPARPGRWVRIVRPEHGGRQRGRARVIPIRAAGEQVGSISLLAREETRPLSEIEDRLLSAIAHQLGQTVARLRFQREATEAEVLRRTDEMRSALLNAVSHDLRTPLASITASGGSLLQDDVTWSEAERRAFAESIVEESGRLDRLVGNLLDLSRIEAGSLHPEKGWYDLPTLLHEAAGRLERAHPDVSFVLDVPAEAAPVQFDYVEIGQVVANLLENAVKHGAGEVSVSFAANAGEVRIEVADNGRGIPEQALPHLFRAFYQAPGAGDRTPGAGLGLAIAHGFVTAHGGRIWAENRPEGGARFAFTLPLSESPARAGQAG